MAKFAGYLFGRDRGAQATASNTNGDSADENNDAIEEGAREEEEARPASTSNLSKRPAPRDIYQLPASPDGANGEDQESRVNSTRKRARTTVKAKKAIVPPKRSSRNNTGVPNKPARAEPVRRTEPARQTRSNNKGVSTPGFSPLKATSNDEPQPTTKRSRGRPRKNPSALPTSTATNTAPVNDTQPSSGVVSTLHEAPDERSAEEEEEEQHEEEEVVVVEQGGLEEREDDGISTILMNPSPIKPIPVTDLRQMNKPAPNATRKDSDSGTEDEECDISRNGELQTGPTGEEGPDLDGEGLLIEDGVLDNMIDVADRVGHYYNKGSRSWTKKDSPLVCSSNGKRFMRRAKGILQTYNNLRASLQSGNVEASEEAENLLADLVEELHTECHSILAKRLGNPALGIKFSNEATTRTMLQDIYFYIIPSLLKILRTATEVYPPKRSMDQTPLRHLYLFITMLADLASTALLQPRDHQPRQQSKSNSWNVTKPTSLLRPDIQRIKKAVSKEFAERELVQKADECERLRLKWARKAENQDRLKDAEIRQRRKEIRRKQREAYEQLVSQPFMSRLLKSKTEARKWHALSQGSYSPDQMEAGDGAHDIDYDKDLPIDDDPFAEEAVDHDGPRLSLFGTNNTNDTTHAKPLSEEEKGVFVECMIFEQGKPKFAHDSQPFECSLPSGYDRYIKAAETLERSLEEIFAFARDLQDAMDRKHEQGQFNGPQDEWTYTIWVEQQ